MRIYVAGPMRGFPQFNFPAFEAAAKKLRSEGHFVFSPHERDLEKHGTDFAIGNHNGDLDKASEEHGFSLREALADDLSWICERAEAIAMLPGWEKSAGAQAEWATARALGLTMIYLK